MTSPQRKQPQHRTPSDLAFLEDLLLSSPRTGAGTVVSPIHQEKQYQTSLTTRLAAARRKKKVPERLRHATAATVRQALFPSGPGSYPSENSPLRGSEPIKGVDGSRRPVPGNDALEYDDEDSEQQEKKHREMCWSTSFPAEYLQPTGTQRDATKQTLAFHEQQLQRQRQQQLEQQQQQQQRLARVMDTRAAKCDETLLRLQKQVVIREGLLAKLHDVVKAATQQREFDISRGSELLHLLLELRDASVEVMQHLVEWHHYCVEQSSLGKRAGGGGAVTMAPLLPAFVFEKSNYCAKMVSDLNFLGTVSTLGNVLGVDPAKMKQNPFMMPEPIPQRVFSGLQTLAWRDLPIAAKCMRKQQRQPRKKDRQHQPDNGQELSNQAAERVAEAETYLVWCLLNLQPPPSDHDESSTANRSPDHPSQSQPTLSSWQKRAEKQLELLSRPLELSSGRAHVMDSSPMMKRKGVLPSLPLSPPKTLTELMDSVRQLPDPDPSLTRVSELPAVEWNGTVFRCSTRELDALGSLNSPPYQIITIVAASVLILLSPSDRLPKDLSWMSCRKMLMGGARLVDRLVSFDVASVPEFKWKALVPFLQNEQFQPRALAVVSNPAACLCAWVLSGMRQSRELAASCETSDVDRLELLGELEVDDVDNGGGSTGRTRPIATADSASEAPHDADRVLAPRLKSKGGKRVSIGNAEILFINENQPVALTPTPLQSRPSSSSSLSPSTQPAASILVRTSPWTFKGVTYFVSFFLEQQQASDQTALSIKLYEPMSSVESQIYVTEEDLREDFGNAALSAFRRREYRGVCELIVVQLDRMMGDLSGRSDRSSRSEEAEPNALDLLSHGETDEDVKTDASTGREAEDEEQLPPSQVEESDQGAAMDAEAAAVRIQCLARQQSAKKTSALLVEGRFGESVCGDSNGPKDEEQQLQRGDPEAEKAAAILRIQCAARQKQARERVQYVRDARQKKVDKEERRRRILTRIPTGMPAEEEEQQSSSRVANLSLVAFAEAEDDDEGDEEGDEKGADAAGEDEASANENNASDEKAIEEGEEGEVEVAAVERPETSMSYASEQFEDDFDEE